jgi:hypothetical protein
MRSEIEYSGYWIEVWTRSCPGIGALKYAVEIRVTADPEELTVRQWTMLGYCCDFRTEPDALEEGMRRGFAWVDAVSGMKHSHTTDAHKSGGEKCGKHPRHGKTP